MAAGCAEIRFYFAEDVFVICLLTGIDNTHPGQDLCNISFSTTRMNLNLGGLNLAGPRKAFAKVLSVI